jgi:hypothetical protein
MHHFCLPGSPLTTVAAWVRLRAIDFRKWIEAPTLPLDAGRCPKGAGLWSLDTVVRGNLHARSDRNLMRPRVSRQRLRAVRCEDLRSRTVVYWTATPLEVAQSLGIGNT